MNDIDLIKSKFNDFNCKDSYVFSAIESIELKLKLLEKLQETLYSTELHLVYKHTAPNGKVYIGITKNLPNARWNEGAGYETQKKFYKAIQTFGWINFKHEIIAAGLSESEAKCLESKLILENRSNEEAFGYNTQVLHSAKEDTIQKVEKQKRKTNVNSTDVSNKMIEQFSIKTINGTIYYLNDGKYIKEKDYPIIKKELLLTYQIESRNHKEIIEQIKILSYAKKEDVFSCGDNTEGERNVNISSFFTKLDFGENSDYFVSDDKLYDNYLIWATQCNIKAVNKTEFLRKAPAWMKKYRVDIERVVTMSKSGWEMRFVTIEGTSGRILTQKGINQIADWLDNTQERIICVPMICDKALGIESKGSRKLGNEICYALRNIIPGWESIGVQRTKEYGNQLCFARK